MLEVLKKLNKNLKINEKKRSIFIDKKSGELPKNLDLHIEVSGATFRFILPYLAFAGIENIKITLGKKLSTRPIDKFIECLNSAGGKINKTDNIVTIQKSEFIADEVFIDSSQSSQFMSSLILFKIGRNLDFIIKTGEIVASPHYIDMTNHVVVKFHEDDVVAEFNLDPDYSTACYYWLYSLIHKKEIWIRSVGEIIQPDYSFFWLLYKYGAKIKDKKGLITLDTNNELPLTKTEILIEMNEMPDQIITLAFLCLVGGMTVKMTGCKILFYKESDRINGIIENIKLMGGKAEYDLTKDELNVSPLFKEPLKCTLKTYNDHRFALTFLVLQKKYPQLSIDNVDCIYKSVDPSFNFFK